MTNDSSIRAFKCPTCGGPLEPEPGMTSMKCPYCSETVIIPESLRISAPSAAPTIFNQPAVFQSGNFSSTTFAGETYSASSNRLPIFIIGGIIAAIIVCVVGGAIAFFAFGFNPFGSMLFANKVMSFGSKGIGQGMFQDARAIGVDGSGNIVVADYEDGRVQIFDPSGKFKSLFTVNDSNGKPIIIQGMAVSGDGKIYVASGGISIYDENGQSVGQIGDSNHYYQDVTIGADGTLYGYTEGDSIVRFKSDSSIDLEIPNAVSSISGNTGGFSHLAVDGLGNMYLTNNDTYAVYKYASNGKFVNQFGGESSDPSQFQPGKFISPLAIAVDGYGRIYVSDFFNVQVFDSTGKYINNVSGSYYGMAFDGQNNLYGTSVNDYNVEKFQIQKSSDSAAVSSNTSSSTNNNPIIPTATPSFANNTLTFGSKGIGQGMFTDGRAVTVDGSGNIIVADWDDGRIQVFDSTGKFVSLISVGQNINLPSIAAGQDGTLYVPSAGNISIMDETGKVQKVIKGNSDTRYYTNVALGSDGTLYALTSADTIIHFDKNYKISLTIPDFTSITNQPATMPYLAVDGQGNIFVLVADEGVVLKFSSAGKFIKQFGSMASGTPTNGQFQQASGIAVDSYGRIFIDDAFYQLQIFDSDGNYLDSINTTGFGLAIDGQNNVYVATGDKIEEFQVQKPQGQ
jgi:tripartite motif-containing protein 71